MTATDTGATPATPEAPVRRTRPTRIAAVVVGIVVALLVVLLATRDPAGERIASADLMGKPAPAIGGDVVLGEPFDLGASDRWVVVNFFATWCVPCQQEHPELRAFAEEHAETGDARVVSVVYDEQPAAVKDFFERKGGDWTVFDADEGRTAVDWGVAKVPESYLVSPTGIVVERFVGGVTQRGLDAVIDAYDRAAAEQTGSGGGS
ncbi:MAG: TlpA disulfide reductase family protein [Acidimicrobiales bacterium]|nr:TlpA family protein disulfide reductase [Actinomycetota bacterium]